MKESLEVSMLPWYFFGLLTAIFAAAASIVGKHTLFKEHAMEFATTLALINALLFTPFLFSVDYGAIPLHGYAIMILTAMLAAIAFLLVTKAIRHLPMSVASPLLSIGPAVTALLAFFMLGETLSPVNLAGLILIILGVYVLEHLRGVSLAQNLKIIFAQKYVRFILLALVLYAAISTADRYLLSPPSIGGVGIPVMDYLAIVHVLISVMYLTMLSFFYDGWRGIQHGIKKAWLPILIIGLLTVSHRIAFGFALSDPAGKVGLAEGLKRTAALFATIVGGELFHEKNMLRRVFSCFVILGGVLLIIL